MFYLDLSFAFVQNKNTRQGRKADNARRSPEAGRPCRVVPASTELGKPQTGGRIRSPAGGKAFDGREGDFGARGGCECSPSPCRSPGGDGVTPKGLQCLPKVSLTFLVVSPPDRGRRVLLGAGRPTEHPLPTPAGNPAGSRPSLYLALARSVLG